MNGPVSFLLVILTYHSLALSVLLGVRTTLRALPLFLLVIAIHMALNVAENAGMNVHAFTGAMGALYGPLAYLFVREAAFADRPVRWSDAILILPFVIALLLPTPGWIRPVLTLSATVLSMIAMARLVMRFLAIARQTRSAPDQARLDWLAWATIGFVIIASLDFARMAGNANGLTAIGDDIGFAMTLVGLLILTGWLAHGAVEHARRGGSLERGEQDVWPVALSDQAASPELIANFERIEATVTGQSLYLTPGLRLAELADLAALTPREASEAINACFDDNFSTYINAYRARHALELINADTAGDRTFLDIALESGFSSKTIFNTFFLREVGLTPSDYAARIRQMQ